MDFVALAKGFATFLRELGIDDPYIILVLITLLGLVAAMWWTMNCIKSSNEEAIKAHKNTINLITNQNKICTDQHAECQKGQQSLQETVNQMNERLFKFLSDERGRQS